jgi:hypothetical protein
MNDASDKGGDGVGARAGAAMALGSRERLLSRGSRGRKGLGYREEYFFLLGLAHVHARGAKRGVGRNRITAFADESFFDLLVALVGNLVFCVRTKLEFESGSTYVDLGL